MLEIKTSCLDETVIQTRRLGEYHPDTLDDAVKILKNAGWDIKKVDTTKKKFFGIFKEKYSVLQIISESKVPQVENK